MRKTARPRYCECGAFLIRSVGDRCRPCQRKHSQETSKKKYELKKKTDEEKKCNKKCEVYSRVVGYYRPVQNWNNGKRAEFADRLEFVYPAEWVEDDRN